MGPYGRRRLRDLFDDAPTPHIAHPPWTHHRDYYVATDGSFFDGGSGLGVIIEDSDGERVLRVARRDDAPDNNAAEYRALHLGLDSLAARAPADARVGVLVDHDGLAANINATALGMGHPDWPIGPVSVPPAVQHHWRGIRARISGFADLRAACIRSGDNPAHVLANAPDEYAHIGSGTVGGDRWAAPPPSRADRHAGD